MTVKEDIRVSIAKDVLAQIAAKKLMAASGVYVSLDEVTRSKNYDLQLNTISATCSVCALGALFMGLVNLQNHCTLGEVMTYHFMNYGRGRLIDVFGFEQVQMIETAFEGYFHKDEIAAAFRNRYENDEEILIAIMQNLIENDGIFIP